MELAMLHVQNITRMLEIQETADVVLLSKKQNAGRSQVAFVEINGQTTIQVRTLIHVVLFPAELHCTM